MEEDKFKSSNDFLDLLMQHQMRIYAYILCMVRNYHDADDIFQNAVKIMFEKYEESLPIKNFVAWGIQIAHFKILDHRKKKANSCTTYDNQLFEQILSVVREPQQYSDGRLEKLRKCLKQLKPRSKKLIELRYYQDLKPKQIASLMGMSIVNVYKVMSRIHGQLLHCVGNSSESVMRDR